MSFTQALARRRGWRWVANLVAEGEADPQPLHERMAVLHAYYANQDLYERLRWGLRQQAALNPEQIDNIRSPAFEAVEFHVGHWFPGSLEKGLPIKRDSPLLKSGQKNKEIVYDVMKASNWASRKQTYARTVCWSGNGFIRVGQRKSDKHPYMRVVEPQHVREFKVDERGFLTYFRSSVPKAEGRGRSRKVVWETDVFDKERDAFEKYRRQAPLDDLDNQAPDLRRRISKEWSIDFIPVVWVPFMETAPGRGTGVFEPFLGEIDNVNRAATRLHDMLFRYNRPTWALERPSLTPEGYEMPPVAMEGSFGRAYTNLSDEERQERYGDPGAFGNRHADGTVNLGADPFANLPSNAVLKSLVPTVDYAAALSIVNADVDDLARKLPELLYNKALESSARDSAGVVRNQLAGAIDRAVEARANAEQGIVRACQMALTIGKAQGLDRFKGLRGTFEDGGLDFAFEDREILPKSDTEKAQAKGVEAQALTELVVLFRSLGYKTDVLKDEVARVSGVDVNELKEDPMQVGVNSEEANAALENGFAGTESVLNDIIGRGARNGRQEGAVDPSTR